MATITLELAGFAYSWTVSNGDAQEIMEAYQSTMPGATLQDVADLIAQGFVDDLVNTTHGLRTNQAVAAARASVTPITITPIEE